MTKHFPLKLGSGIYLPASAVTETFGLLAVRGAGKSNAAAVMAEEMFKEGLPFVVIDPVAAWWGLRSSADGKGPGLPIPIFGGKRGDVPLERHGGKLIADLVVDQRLSCILDLTTLESEGAKKQFLLDFARRLYTRNEEPLHLFLEEADDYIPQKPMRDEVELLRAFENIVRRGRGRGLGMTLITQRSAVVNKNVLTQVQTLIPMRISSPQDRDAIEAWVKYHGQSYDILSSLPSLEDGEAWIWSPHFLGMTKRVQFRRRSTFDSGATPKMQKAARKAATLADIDLPSLSQEMTATIERAKQTDPKVLQARINDLERELRTKSVPVVPKIQPPSISPKEIERLQKQMQAVRDALSGGLDSFASELRTFGEAMTRMLERVAPAMQKIINEQSGKARVSLMDRPRSTSEAFIGPPIMRAKVQVENNGRLPVGEKAILAALAQSPHDYSSRAYLTVMTGYKRSSRDAYVSRLQAKGYVETRGSDVGITPEGGTALGADVETLPTGAALQQYWIDRLPEGESKIFALLVQHGPMSSELLSEQTGYKRSSRDAYLSRLRNRQLVISEHGTHALSPHLK